MQWGIRGARLGEATPRPVVLRRGFSLIELLVVFTIMTIIGAIVMSGLRSYGEQQEFRSIITDVRDNIVKARQDTIASVNDSRYGVHVSSTAVVRFTGDTFTAGDADNSAITLPETVTASWDFSDGGQTLVFARLTGLPSATGTISLFDTRSSQQATVTISNTGLVQ